MNQISSIGIPFFSTRLIKSKWLEKFFWEFKIIPFFLKSDSNLTAIIGWGRKPSGNRARILAKYFGTACWLIEDGFIRSVDLGNIDRKPLSIVVDDQGIYYDSTSPSRLEYLIKQFISNEEKARSHAILTQWRNARITKYNHLRESELHQEKPYVLVIDQTLGDASILFGQANQESFQRMLLAALEENPDSRVIVKTHPDVHAGRKQGNFDLSALKNMPRVEILAQDIHPVGLIEHATSVYVVTSQLGFEALIWGKQVRTFGMPFYAGWGLTKDDLPPPNRRRPVCLENLIHAALITYPRYIDPETEEPCGPERVIEWLGLQRKMRERYPEQIVAIDFSSWKKPIVRDFLQGSKVTFLESKKNLSNNDDSKWIVTWGMKSAHTAHPSSQNIVSKHTTRNQAPSPSTQLRIEDGFIRSIGLGAHLIRPISWVIDQRGMYYDATKPSDLEYLAQNHAFPPSLLYRAAALRQRIVALGISKYNVGSGEWSRPPDQKRIILVPGQVESDASIAYGAPQNICSIRSNMALLKAVRLANPDAHVIYKPHPDVVSGLRIKGLEEDEALNWCDEQVTDIPVTQLLVQVDEVHVITSLTGFEALLRQKHVVCYGQPFYSGWGLTEDIVPLRRRTRRLSLDMLVAAALILYPTYVSRATNRYTTPERAVEELLEWKDATPDTPSLFHSVFRKFLRLYKR